LGKGESWNIMESREAPGESESQGPSDSELMARFYDCDPTAFDSLFCRWRPRLFGFFRKLGFVDEDCEDLSQDVLVRLHLTRENRSFDVTQPLTPYLLTAAKNLAIETWRRREPQRQALPIIEYLDLETLHKGPRHELLDDLLLCIWSLPPTLQLYVMMCEKHGLGDLSHNEIAEIMGKWPAQMTILSHKARAFLLECLTDKGYQ
jgi:DNA-directed RNA polymerase specialized sigma24 family protein